MKFVVVNRQDTQPAILLCAVIQWESYLRELATGLSYCDHNCYFGNCKIAFPALQYHARAS